MAQKFWVLLVLWVVLRSTLLFYAWHGDASPERRNKVLQHFTASDIDKGREYVRSGFVAKFLSSFVVMFFLLVFVFGGYSENLFEWVTAMTGGPGIKASVAFLLCFFALSDLVSIPFGYYLGYVCEKNMGFSTMTAMDWFIRHFKGIAISWPLQTVLILSVLWVIQTLPKGWPWLIPFVTTVFGIAITVLFPLLITPLFYEQKPLADGPLKTKILEIAGREKIPIEGIYEIDESRYSKHTNAYFTGLFGQKRIVLYDTLIKSHTVDEAALIFAHEVGHWLHDHVFIGLFLGFFGTLFGSFIISFLFPYVQSEPLFRLKELWSVGNFPFYVIVSMMLQLFTAPVESQISQVFERQADRASLTLTGLTQTFIDAEVRLARDNHSELLPHPLRVFWLYSHPPAIDRIGSVVPYLLEAGKPLPDAGSPKNEGGHVP